MRSVSWIFIALLACQGTVDIKVDTGVTDSLPDDSGTTTGDPGQQPMQELLTVTTNNDPYAGYHVVAFPSGLVGMTDGSAQGAYFWDLDLENPRTVSLETDGSDIAFESADAFPVTTLVVPASGAMTNGYVCFGAAYYSIEASNGGVLVCFSDTKFVQNAALALDDADILVRGLEVDMYIGDEGRTLDADADGEQDLLLTGNETAYVLGGIWQDAFDLPPESLPLVLDVPGGETFSFPVCTDNPGLFCAPQAISDDQVLFANSDGTTSGFSLYTFDLPLSAASVPSASVSGGNVAVAFEAAWSPYGWIVNDPSFDQFVVYSTDLSESDTILMPEGGEAWGISLIEDGDALWLALGAPDAEDGEGNVSGAIYVADISAGMIDDAAEDAQYVAVPFGDNRHCGNSIDMEGVDGAVVLAAGCYTTNGNDGQGMVAYAVRPTPPPPGN